LRFPKNSRHRIWKDLKHYIGQTHNYFEDPLPTWLTVTTHHSKNEYKTGSGPRKNRITSLSAHKNSLPAAAQRLRRRQRPLPVGKNERLQFSLAKTTNPKRAARTRRQWKREKRLTKRYVRACVCLSVAKSERVCVGQKFSAATATATM